MTAGIASYRRVLGLPGALVFSASGLVARLPMAMVSLGIVLLVSDRTGSYSLAGAVSASFLVANAALAVPQARLIDRVGQHRVLPVAAALSSAGLVGMMAAVEAGRTAPWPHLGAVPWPEPRCRRSGRRSAPGGRTWSTTEPTCTPRSRSSRWSTKWSSSWARPW